MQFSILKHYIITEPTALILLYFKFYKRLLFSIQRIIIIIIMIVTIVNDLSSNLNHYS